MEDKVGRTKIMALVLVMAIFIPAFASQPDSINMVLKKAEEKMAATLVQLKELPDEMNTFFARAKTSLAEQMRIAESRMQTLRNLLKPGGAENPDYYQIIHLTTEILRQAPDTEAARNAHWDMHDYLLKVHNVRGARDALMSYLHKYGADAVNRKGAFEKLADLAADDKEWDLALYYSEKGLEISAGSPVVLLSKARALVNLGFLPEGKVLLQSVAKANPGSSHAEMAMNSLKQLEQADFNPNLLKGYRETMKTMKEIGAAAATYYVDFNQYPRTIKELYPAFLQELTEKDAWGNAFVLRFDSNANRFLVASGGSDGVFNGFDQQGFYVDLQGKDIIFCDGAFVYAPKL